MMSNSCSTRPTTHASQMPAAEPTQRLQASPQKEKRWAQRTCPARQPHPPTRRAAPLPAPRPLPVHLPAQQAQRCAPPSPHAQPAAHSWQHRTQRSGPPGARPRRRARRAQRPGAPPPPVLVGCECRVDGCLAVLAGGWRSVCAYMQAAAGLLVPNGASRPSAACGAISRHNEAPSLSARPPTQSCNARTCTPAHTCSCWRLSAPSTFSRRSASRTEAARASCSLAC